MRLLDRCVVRDRGQDRTETAGTMAAACEAAQRGDYTMGLYMWGPLAKAPRQIKDAEAWAAAPLPECAS